MCYCVIETSSVLPWKSSVIFGILRQFSENVQKRLSGLRRTFGKSSEVFLKGSEILIKSSKKSSLVCLYNKQNNRWLLVALVFNLISHSFAAPSREISS